MIPTKLTDFRAVYLVDFEFSAPPGERPTPICLVARELKSRRRIRLWEDDLRRAREPPYPTDPQTLFVAYYASAEIGCHLSLDWPEPHHILDLYTEFRNHTNGRDVPCGNGLLGALAYFGLDAIAGAEKETMRDLAIRGGPWTVSERIALLRYCEQDVDALDRLLSKMARVVDLPRALHRGQYMAAAARIEAVGVPIDVPAHRKLTTHWDALQDRLIARIDNEYEVFDGRTFRASRWECWLATQHIPWPRLPSGALALDDDTFREMARSHPLVTPMRELRVALSQMRLADLSIGHDHRNRCLLSAFRARTGRNQPSNSRFIFGPSVWLRGLIKPAPGVGLAYVDWAQQEFGIAAALSGDPNMWSAYESGDPYLAFAKQAAAVPPSATKQTHGYIRDQFKACALAVQYGMGDVALGQRIGQSTSVARELLRLHHETYRVFWRWSDGALDYARLRGSLHSVFGWTIHTGDRINTRSLRNFPMQANGAEMLRLACCLTTAQRIRVCAPVHDAILVEAPLAQLDDTVRQAQQAMVEASTAVLSGMSLRSDATVFRSPERYVDPRGRRMWDTVWQLIEETENGSTVGSHPNTVCIGAT